MINHTYLRMSTGAMLTLMLLQLTSETLDIYYEESSAGEEELEDE